jgi:hypothetical protein
VSCSAVYVYNVAFSLICVGVQIQYNVLRVIPVFWPNLAQLFISKINLNILCHKI